MNQARATGCAWCLVPETGRAGGYTHLREYEEFMNLFSPALTGGTIILMYTGERQLLA